MYRSRLAAAVVLALVALAMAGCRHGDGQPAPNYYTGEMRSHAMVGTRSSVQAARQ